MNLNQVTLPCGDLAESVGFYEALGFTQIVSSPPRYARFECEAGATFSLHRVDNPARDTGVVVYFEVDDLDTVVAKLKSDGIRFESGPEDQSWLWREARLRDPAGNQLCLYRAGKSRRFPPWRIQSVCPV